ncbi:(Fe-S)-binding protein [Ectothiorhodospiraceae bacterium BW-2]|nr:(Fe-S)-binding protein [Ectothiorhodospiraceae bacterium BW-2]
MMQRSELLAAIDQCVLCGLCLPHCPTFLAEGREPESPRGRLMLLQAVAKGEIAPTEVDQTALNHCLLCRNCETHCPSQVRYSEIVVAARASILPLPADGGRERLLDAVAHPRSLALLGQMGQWYQKSGLQRVVRRRGWVRGELARLESLLPDYRPLPLEPLPQPSTQQGRVALFRGCMGNQLEPVALEAAKRLLQSCGFEVVEFTQPQCCGALHSHAGEIEQGDRLALATLAQLERSGADWLVGVSSSCIAQLLSFAALDKITTVEALLLRYWPNAWQPAPLSGSYALHTPCSNRNRLNNSAEAVELLTKIPQLVWQRLPVDGCCGAGGSHLLSDPEHAASFAIAPLQWLQQQPLGAIISTNIGCTLHLGAEARRRGVEIALYHPLELLLRSLLNSPSLPPH